MAKNFTRHRTAVQGLGGYLNEVRDSIQDYHRLFLISPQPNNLHDLVVDQRQVVLECAAGIAKRIVELEKLTTETATRGDRLFTTPTTKKNAQEVLALSRAAVTQARTVLTQCRGVVEFNIEE